MKMVENISLSDCVNMLLCILSFLLAAISIVTVVITLKQNRKMIENASRPYLSIYGAMTQFQNPQYYLVLKNFGASAAKIIDFTSSIDLSKCVKDNKSTPFIHIVNTTIAPSQSLCVPLDFQKAYAISEKLSFVISYQSATGTYKEVSEVFLPAYSDFPMMRASTDGNELKIVSYTLQDIAERML